MSDEKLSTSPAVATDPVVCECCAAATRLVLARRHWHGDVTRVRADQHFTTTYHYTDDEMPEFTLSVNVELNRLLVAAGKKPVVLATGIGQTVSASATVGDFIAAICVQASVQQ